MVRESPRMQHSGPFDAVAITQSDGKTCHCPKKSIRTFIYRNRLIHGLPLSFIVSHLLFTATKPLFSLLRATHYNIHLIYAFTFAGSSFHRCYHTKCRPAAFLTFPFLCSLAPILRVLFFLCFITSCRVQKKPHIFVHSTNTSICHNMDFLSSYYRGYITI